ncbi:trypsin-like serine protease [Candidatus Pacearchaeota archaeon]|nr:trypsin-like serine protease [Candidatus Pacearchaeota archaeon]
MPEKIKVHKIHHVKLKRHHRWIIGSFTSLILILMVTLSIFTYMIFIRQEFHYNVFDKQINDLRLETKSDIGSLSEGLISIKEELKQTSSKLGIISEEFSYLKASVGEDFSGIIETVIPSVVTIKTDFGQGSGFIIHEEGFVVTNAHVLADNLGRLAPNIRVVTYQQDIISADFVGYNSTFDMALLKIEGTYYNPLELEDSNSVQIGERVIAIGNPLGLQFSVSQGIVSAVHREGLNEIEAYIQTDAALNPGNSGGPLINKKGLAIGINNFKVGSAESLGFALESNFIKNSINGIASKELGRILLE